LPVVLKQLRQTTTRSGKRDWVVSLRSNDGLVAARFRITISITIHDHNRPNFSPSARPIDRRNFSAALLQFPRTVLSCKRCRAAPKIATGQGLPSRVVRRRMNENTYIIGKSGSGKSTLLENLCAANSGGWIFIDPHGDSAAKIADTVDCIYWDAADADHAVGFNVLEHVPEPRRHLVASQVVSAFKAIWDASWGPRLEWILYCSLRVLLDNNGSVVDLPALLTDPSFRKRCLRRSRLTDFWVNEFDRWDDRYRNEAIAPVLNKVGQFVANPILRNILCHNTIRIRRIMDRGDRLVVNLAKGKVGEAPSYLLGALLVSAIASAAESRADMAPGDRTPVTLYVDEFQHYATDAFASILSESRKFGLQISMAHQFLGQTPEPVRQAIFGNVGCLWVFRVGTDDAPVMAKELGLKNPEILLDLSPFTAYRRTGLEPERIEAPRPIASRGRFAANVRQTRAAYTRTPEQIHNRVAKPKKKAKNSRWE
jgi:energy-coupling factor transporter ATP-binding protein EcfA2